MNPLLFIIMVFGGIILLLASGMWIAVALGVIGVIVLYVFVGGGTPGMIGILAFNSINSFVLTAVPLFIFMGELLLRSGISERLYKGATALVGFLPGGLLHTNIASCSVFAAVSGSSLATAATIGVVAIADQMGRGYDRKLLFGSLAGGATLGILIPPSIPMILYGAMTLQSVAKLFMAGIVPGLILAWFFMTYIGVISVRYPHLVPKRLKFSWRAALFAIGDIWPTLLLIFLVLGTIYLGVATPTESAAFGASGSLILVTVYRRLTWQTVKESALGAVKISAWIMLILLGAQILSMGLSSLQVPVKLTELITAMAINRMVVLAIIIVFYLILGCFIDAISMIILTVPVVYPLMTSLGFDPIWLGVMLTICIEMGLVTPPVGMNLYVIHGITEGKYLRDIIIGVVPFLICMILLLIVITVFPILATWLPGQMFKAF